MLVAGRHSQSEVSQVALFKLTGIREKYDALEVFRPERMASRILGMGDVLSLIEKAEAVVDQERAAEMIKRLQSEGFTLEGFRQ